LDSSIARSKQQRRNFLGLPIEKIGMEAFDKATIAGEKGLARFLEGGGGHRYGETHGIDVKTIITVTG